MQQALPLTPLLPCPYLNLPPPPSPSTFLALTVWIYAISLSAQSIHRGCKDIDDALHCIRLENGNIQAGVHIADVTYFVPPDSPFDKETCFRSTSTYLVDRRLDMLPEMLTTALCSLRGNEDHLTFSVIKLVMDTAAVVGAEVVDVQFFESIIHSMAALTFQEAQEAIDLLEGKPHGKISPKFHQANKPSLDHLLSSLLLLTQLGRVFKRRRNDVGALTLANVEVKFKFDAIDASASSSDPSDVGL